MRQFVFIILSILIGTATNAQTLSLSPIIHPNSIKESIVCAGTNMDGSLYLLDQKGDVFQVKNNWLEPTRFQIMNPKDVEDFAVYRNTIFFIKKGKLIKQQGDEAVELYSDVDGGYFLYKKSKLYLNSKNACYQLQDSNVQKVDTPVKYKSDMYPFAEHSFLQYQNNKLTLLNKYGSEVSSINTGTSNPQMIQDAWNQNFILHANQLYRIQLIQKSQINPIDYPLYQTPLQTCLWNGARLLLFDDGNIYSYANNSCVSIFDRNEIQWKKMFNKAGELLLLDQNNALYWAAENRVRKIDFHGTLSTDIQDIAIHQDILSVLLTDGSILQSKINETLDDWTWTPSLFNKKIKTYHLDKITSFQGNLWGLSTQYGLLKISPSTTKLIQLPTGDQVIEEWNQDEDNLYVITSKNNIFHLNNSEKLTLLTPMRQDFQWVIEQDPQYFMSNDSLFKWNQLTNTINFTNRLVEFDKQPIWTGQKHVYFPTEKVIWEYANIDNPEQEKTPILHTLRINLNDGTSKVLTYPFRKDTIQLTRDQWPIRLSHQLNWNKDTRDIKISIQDLDKSTYHYKEEIQIPYQQKFRQLVYQIHANDKKYSQALPVIHTTQKLEEKSTFPWIWVSAFFAGLLGLGFVFFRWKSNAQKKKIEELNVKNRLLELEQKSLQLQMNPHFLFNAINGIQGMIALNKGKEARKYLGKLAQLMRSMLNHSRENTVQIDSELALLKNYMDIEKALHGEKWNYTFDIDPTLDQSQKIPPMMIQPFLENAIKHAFKGVDYQGEIKLALLQKGRRLICQIEDNGIGFESSKQSDKTHKSLALEVIKSRLQWLNQGTSLEEFKIESKNTEDESGTIIHIVIPIIHE